MTYTLTLVEKTSFLHACVVGFNNRETVRAYLEEVFATCIAKGCTRLLIEEQLDGPRLGMADVFQIIVDGSRRYFGLMESIAYVDYNNDGSMLRFAESVAINRAFPLRIFPNAELAEMWLISQAERYDNGAPSTNPL